jgi:hypothetical protein
MRLAGFAHTVNLDTHNAHIVQLLLYRSDLLALGEFEPKIVLLSDSVNLRSDRF